MCASIAGKCDIYFTLESASRPVGSGAAWRRSPHQKSAGREREKEEKGGKKEKREERKEKRKRKEKGEESKRKGCIRPIDVKHPIRTVKRL